MSEENLFELGINQAVLVKKLVGAENAKHRARFVFLQMKVRYQNR